MGRRPGGGVLRQGHGQPVRHRLDLLGNRTVNSVYTMSITQARYHEPARAYLERKRASGKTTKEARRSHKTLLGRRIIRRMWRDCRARTNPVNDLVCAA